MGWVQDSQLQQIVDKTIMEADKDGDGKISLEELQVVGLDGLPNFEDLGAEGHHYDVESGMCNIYTCKS